jgi:uncharacterized glyoxalase superfamily protein PhnB
MSTIDLKKVVPILRIFSVDKAHEFYLDFLGFKVDWEHRFGEKFPLYLQVSRSGVVLHLSEHHGDGSPGAAIIVNMTGVDDYLRELAAKDYRYYKPGIEEQPWGARTITVRDPFGNRIVFSEPNDQP